jgi:hypothetical protein
MNRTQARLNLTLAAAVAVAGMLLTSSLVCAQTPIHLTVTQPGGMPGLPVMNSIELGSNTVTVTWDGPSGYYQLFQKPGLSGGTWQPVTTNYTRSATLAVGATNAFFRVAGPKPQYAGAISCAECHPNIHESEMNTRHAHALETLQAAHSDTNPSCLPCHTVGYGLPSGFTSAAATPYLAGVQCENCHGPAAYHAANPDDITLRPRVELAAQVCGGCHTGLHHPTFDEWKTSGHFAVVEDMSPSSRVSSCGRCHSGSARLAMLQGRDPMTVTNDANVGLTCVVCHNPHQTNANPAQLRYPLASTNDYYLTTSDVFTNAALTIFTNSVTAKVVTNKFNPNINVCAQCHNHRGASWSSSSRPPHHSPQYNMLLATVGEVTNAADRHVAGHAYLTNQCVTCHMQTVETAGSTPAITGHSFRVEVYDACLQCHPFPELLAQFTMGSVATRIQQVKASLDQWATTKAPAALQSKYGVLAWEYSTPGGLSTGTAGPTSAEQAQIPVNIQKARYNLYLVYHDGSFGVHNGPYSIKLLDTAAAWVQAEPAP